MLASGSLCLSPFSTFLRLVALCSKHLSMLLWCPNNSPTDKQAQLPSDHRRDKDPDKRVFWSLGPKMKMSVTSATGILRWSISVYFLDKEPKVHDKCVPYKNALHVYREIVMWKVTEPEGPILLWTTLSSPVTLPITQEEILTFPAASFSTPHPHFTLTHRK